eukprot:7430548-Karenia_brevis.AAC.1
MIQKAAAPVDRHTHDLHAVAKSLSCQRPNAVVMEKTSKSEMDFNAMHHNAFKEVAQKVQHNTSVDKKGNVTFAQSSQKLSLKASDVPCLFTEAAVTDNILGLCQEW